jgi:ribA/ribD-fused uncharacterized protein
VTCSQLQQFPHGAPFQLQGPWDRPETAYFYKGPFSSFARIASGVQVPTGYRGHPRGELCTAFSRESYFQACKASDRDTFYEILRASPAQAKRLGGPGGIIAELRDDWPQVRYAVMLTFNRRQWRLDGWRELLLMTGGRPLAERSPSDRDWGCADPRTGAYDGLNLLGICHMHVREELRAEFAACFGADRAPALQS